MSEERQLYVVKGGASKNPDIGSIRIIAVSSPSQEITVAPSIDEFPTLGVWISKGYEQIDERYKDGEVFRLTNWVPQDDDRELGLGTDKHLHWALGSSAKPVDSTQFLPVYPCDLPDTTTGELKLSNPIQTKPFFLLNTNCIYGPFRVIETLENGIIKISSHPQTIINIQNNHILKIPVNDLFEKSILIPNRDADSPKYYLNSLRNLSPLDKTLLTEVDLITDEQLIAYFAKGKFGKKAAILSRKEAEKLKQGINELVQKKTLSGDGERTRRLTTLLDTYLSTQDIGGSIVDDYLRSPEGKSFLDEYFEKKPTIVEKFYDSKKSEKQKLNNEIAELEGKFKELKEQSIAQRNRVDSERRLATDEIEKERKKTADEIDKIREQSKEQLQKERQIELGELQTDLINAQTQLDSTKKNLESELDSLVNVNRLVDLKKETEFYERKLLDVKDSVTSQTNTLNNPQLPAKMTEVKTLIDLLQGRISNSNETSTPSFTPPRLSKTLPNDGKEFVNSLIYSFEEDGYNIYFEELVNMLICIQQSFLTVLSGSPGSGKTSSIIKLAQHQGLQQEEEQSDCFLNVPVSRGWVSSRDFIGFNNSLKGFYQPAKTGIYQFLRAGEDKESEKYLRLILLDEAKERA